jgi:hypothetical protein
MKRFLFDLLSWLRFKWRAGRLALQLAELRRQAQRNTAAPDTSNMGLWQKGWAIMSDPLVQPIVATVLLGLLASFGFNVSRSDMLRIIREWPLASGAVMLGMVLVPAMLLIALRMIRYGSINRLMRVAAESRAGTLLLAQYWNRGTQNDAFLQSLFALYETQVAELNRHAGGTEPPFELTRATQPVRHFTGALMLHLSTPLAELLIPSPQLHEQRNGRDLEKTTPLDERDLAHWSRLAFTDARTRFLKQWQRARRKDITTALTPTELDDAIIAQERGPNYILEAINHASDRVQFQVKLGGYGQIMRSCDYLIEEAIIAGGLMEGIDREPALKIAPARLLWTMPMRRGVFHQGGIATFAKPTDRAVGIGLAGLVTWKDAGGLDHFVFKRRSMRVGTYPNSLHCVPTGMFNGKFQRDDEFPNDLRHHGVRVLMTEFFEELFSRDELEHFEEDQQWMPKLRRCLAQYLTNPELFQKQSLDWKRERMKDKLALAPVWPEPLPETVPSGIEIALIGVPFDLLSLRPEIAIAIRLPGPGHALFCQELLNEEGAGLTVVPGEGLKPYADGPRYFEWVKSGQAAYLYGKTMVQRETLEWHPLETLLDP